MAGFTPEEIIGMDIIEYCKALEIEPDKYVEMKRKEIELYEKRRKKLAHYIQNTSKPITEIEHKVNLYLEIDRKLVKKQKKYKKYLLQLEKNNKKRKEDT